MLQLQDISENINCIYVHLLNTDVQSIYSRYKFIKRYFISYWVDNMNYVYEKNNDNQCLMKYNLIDVDKSDKYIMNMFNEVKLPIYIFPSVPYSYKEEYTVYEHKLNSRTTLCIQGTNVYIVYKHKKTCDIQNYIKDIEIFLV